MSRSPRSPSATGPSSAAASSTTKSSTPSNTSSPHGEKNQEITDTIQTLLTQGDTRTIFKINIINLATSIPLASILIPTHGVPGLITSTLTSQLISTTYGLHQVHRMYHMNIEWISSLKILATSLLSTLPVYIILKLVPLTNPIYSLALGGTLYIASLLVFAPILGAVNLEDIENLEGLINELPLIHPIARSILRVEKKILELNLSHIKT